MKNFILLLILIQICNFGKAQTNYYVSLTGNDSNSGLSEANAWKTINFALSSTGSVTAGDTVFIKAGDYGNENVYIYLNGTVNNPIVIEGYQNVPGDNPNLNYVYGDALDASIMPMLNGGDRTSSYGIFIDNSSNIVLKNIQITNYASGIYTWDNVSTNITLDNIQIMSIGDINSSYTGLGIGIIYANNNIVKNCNVINSCAEGISVVSDGNVIENCKVFCDEDMTVYASTDYYIVATGDNNTFKNCYIERVGNLEHVGHGMGLKENGQNNLFENCEAKNFIGGGFYVRWQGVTNNEFRNCKAIGTQLESTGFLIRDGASNNTFNNCISDGCSSAFMFLVSGESANYCGSNNVFNNCIVTDAKWSIDFLDWAIAGPVSNNLFANCVFYNSSHLFRTGRINNNNRMVNCIVSDVDTLFLGSEPLNFDFSYTDFYNNGFSPQIGTGNISSNPLFNDASNHNFHLQNSSFCINNGTAIDAPSTDFDGIFRPQGGQFDIGAFEFVDHSGFSNNTSHTSLIYPNPTEGILHLSNTLNNSKYEIFSMNLESIKSGQVKNNRIDISSINTGIYYLKINETLLKIIKL